MPVPLLLSHIALWVVVIFQTLLLLGLVRAVHQLRQAGATRGTLDLLANGQPQAPAPNFTAVDIFGRTVEGSSFQAELTGLLFVSPTCESCTVSYKEMLEQLLMKTSENVIVICKGEQEECRLLAESSGHPDVPVVVDEDSAVSNLFKVTSVPTGVLIDDRGQIVNRGVPMRGDEANQLEAQAQQMASVGERDGEQS